MILTEQIENQAVMSNVAAVGEFRIKNSAKAFGILSSGLYANKIRAIIRELSCNAVDSHVAAGKADVPFEVHLPNTIEGWFSVRDYGTGLSRDQVENIYTTYFESTKTNSNDFIGALGLGSKSPFSYTDNFTVTAIKDGKKGIFSAFINDSGVPSIAVMGESDTDEPNGVEVKFNVDSREDFYKFQQEARIVLRWFKNPLKLTGANFVIEPVKYAEVNIVPGVGVNLLSADSINYDIRSIAVMGNIAYPIVLPNAASNIGELNYLLSISGLVFFFEIGELEFQASREGLSYVPKTIDAIKAKLQVLHDSIEKKLTADADAIENLWERTDFLSAKYNISIWQSSVLKYVSKNQTLFTKNPSRWTSRPEVAYIDLSREDIATKYNIKIRQFNVNYNGCSAVFDKEEKVDHILPYMATRFVINNSKRGIFSTVRNHYAKSYGKLLGSQLVRFIHTLSPVNEELPMDTENFFKNELQSPPKSLIVFSEELDKPVTAPRTNNSSYILELLRTGANQYSSFDDKYAWKESGTFNSGAFPSDLTYYYVPLNGFKFLSNYSIASVKELVYNSIESMVLGLNIRIYGVRKTEIDEVKKLKNWINLEDFITDKLKNVDDSILTKICLNSSMSGSYMACPALYTPGLGYNNFLNKLKYSDGPMYSLLSKLRKFQFLQPDHRTSDSYRRLMHLYSMFGIDSSAVKKSNEETCKQIGDVLNTYPLLKMLGHCHEPTLVADYINLVDKANKI